MVRLDGSQVAIEGSVDVHDRCVTRMSLRSLRHSHTAADPNHSMIRPIGADGSWDHRGVDSKVQETLCLQISLRFQPEQIERDGIAARKQLECWQTNGPRSRPVERCEVDSLFRSARTRHLPPGIVVYAE